MKETNNSIHGMGERFFALLRDILNTSSINHLSSSIKLGSISRG